MTPYYLNTVSGQTTVTNPAIVSTTIMNLKRDGIGFNEVPSSLGERDFVYDILTGKFSFLNPFTGETIYVLCL